MVGEIYIANEIGWYQTGSCIADQIRCYDSDETISEIHIYVNSEGGNILDMMNIVSAIKSCSTPTVTHNLFLAASAASLIALSGKKCVASENAVYLFHKAFDALNPGATNPLLDELNNSLSAIYKKYTGVELEDGKDIIITAKQAKKMGMISDIVAIGEKIMQWVSSVNMQIVQKVKQLINTGMEIDKPVSDELIEAAEINSDVTASADLQAEQNVEDQLADEADVADEAEISEPAKSEPNPLEAYLAELKKELADLRAVVTAQNDQKEAEKQAPAKVRVIQSVNEKIKVEDEKANWTYRQWETNDKKGLREMQQNRPLEFKALVEASYPHLKGQKIRYN